MLPLDLLIPCPVSACIRQIAAAEAEAAVASASQEAMKQLQNNIHAEWRTDISRAYMYDVIFVDDGDVIVVDGDISSRKRITALLLAKQLCSSMWLVMLVCSNCCTQLVAESWTDALEEYCLSRHYSPYTHNKTCTCLFSC